MFSKFFFTKLSIDCVFYHIWHIWVGNTVLQFYILKVVLWEGDLFLKQVLAKLPRVGWNLLFSAAAFLNAGISCKCHHANYGNCISSFVCVIDRLYHWKTPSVNSFFSVVFPFPRRKANFVKGQSWCQLKIDFLICLWQLRKWALPVLVIFLLTKCPVTLSNYL